MASLFSKPPKPPAIQPPAPLPVPIQQNELLRQQQRRMAVTQAQTQTGRDSTILTNQGTTDKLGG